MPFCPTGDPLEQAADMVDQGIQQIKYQTGFTKIHLIGHGGGAILARYYIAMRDGGGRSVRTLSLVSAPNQGSLLAILSSNRSGFERMWPAYPFWKMYTGGTLYSSPQNQLLSQVLGFKAPNVPTAVIYGTGTETPALAVGSPHNPYLIENGTGDGVVLASSATALVGATFVPIHNLKFTSGLSNPAVGAAVAAHILAH
jgi:pimeloyl-ACP methyl ester carboxylesterase